MTLAKIGQIRDGIANAINTSIGASKGITAFPRWPDAYPSFPIAVVMPQSMDYHRLMGDGGGILSLEVLVVVSIGTNGYERAQSTLDEFLDFMSGESVHDAVEQYGTLNGVVKSIIVTGFDNYGSVAINQIEYLGARVLMEVST